MRPSNAFSDFTKDTFYYKDFISVIHLEVQMTENAFLRDFFLCSFIFLGQMRLNFMILQKVLSSK